MGGATSECWFLALLYRSRSGFGLPLNGTKRILSGVADCLPQRGRVHRRRADALELALPSLVQARQAIGYDDQAEIALARLVKSGSRAVREVAATEGDRGNAQIPKVPLEPSAVEGAPARLVEHDL